MEISTGFAALLQQAFADLDRHMDDPDNSDLSGHGMLELTRNRLATLAAMLYAPTPVNPLPRCRDCSGVIVWSASRNGWTHRDFTPVAHAVTPGDDAWPSAEVREVATEPTDNVIGWTNAEPVDDGQHFDIDAVYRAETVRYRNATPAMLENLRRRHAEAPDFLIRLDVRPATESGAPDAEPEPDVEIGPDFPTACSSMHEHDPIECAPGPEEGARL